MEYKGIPVPEELRPNIHAEYTWFTRGVQAALERAVPIVEALRTEEPCSLDHGGRCQEHWGVDEIDGRCAEAEAVEFIDRAGPEAVWLSGGLVWCYEHKPFGVREPVLHGLSDLSVRTYTCVQCGRKLKGGES